MKRILPIVVGLFLFGCEKANRTIETETTTENVEKGAGTEVSPQLEGVQDSSVRLKVDTISSAKEAQHAE